MEVMKNKRSRPNEDAKKPKVQWMLCLPEDIWSYIFLNYCDFDSIVTTRILQSKYVKHCTEGNEFKLAIRANNLDNVKWIFHCGGDELTDMHYEEALEFGTLSIMKWLREKECPWRSWTFSCAAMHGDLNKMKWLKANDCPWGEHTFAQASGLGDLNNMKWLKENGCPWDEETFEDAALFEHIEVLDWLFLNNCPWGPYTFITIGLKDLDMQTVNEWLVNHSMITMGENCLK